MSHKVQKLLEDIRSNSNKKVTLYTMSHCPACKELKEKLNQLNIKYENIEMEGNDEMWRILKEQGGQDYVPQARVEDKLISDFNEINDLIGFMLTEIIGRTVIIK